jgi:DmsE family decaheme c-type cytochrome
MGGIALLLFFGLSAGTAVAAPPDSAAQSDTLSCGDCHDQAKVFTGNIHARGKVVGGVVPNAVCESCHGNGAAHIEGGGDKTKITKPAGRAGSELCLTCHDKPSDQMTRHAGMHSNSETVNCLTCHSVHGSDPTAQHLLVKTPTELCSTCHTTQAASFRNKPYAHRLGRGGMECTSCHNPHGRPGKDSLKQTPAGEAPCYGCHGDKRGPFVFPHDAGQVGDCLSCHEQHGSVNPKQLKRANVYQLCIECHSPIGGGTLGSQPPAFHNLTLARYQNCTTCHVAVHGSNRSPQLLK